MVIPVLVVQRQLGSVDLAYQHCAGELMLRTHSVIRADPFSFTAHGRPWLDQQCGSQLVLYLTYRALGWVGLAALHAALVALTMSFAYLAARAAGGPDAVGGLAEPGLVRRTRTTRSDPSSSPGFCSRYACGPCGGHWSTGGDC